ncbi:MAG: phosphoglycerate dehydrogenase, partial [Gammaproteobacteria bacterium]|nr:phosphoglycerate dehydrogenase [Gammaproteobacteria bacterium]
MKSRRPAGAALPRFSRPDNEMKFLLLEGIHNNAIEALSDAGFERIEQVPKALPEDDLIARIGDVQYLGIRSSTKVTRRVIDAAPQLRAIGCFCIGTNQVDVNAARDRGVPVFNAPFSNTRSVAELVLAEAVLLLRDIPRKNASAHRGEWLKSASGAVEVRGKHLG